jgi:hypothetical protein
MATASYHPDSQPARKSLEVRVTELLCHVSPLTLGVQKGIAGILA